MFKLKNYKLSVDGRGMILFLVIMIPNFIWFTVPAGNDVLKNVSMTPTVDRIASIFQVIMVAALCMLRNKMCPRHMKRSYWIGIV